MVAEGISNYRNNDPVAAIPLFTDALHENDRDHISWNGLGLCYAKIGKYYKAHDCLTKAIKLNPNSGIYQKNLKKIETKIENDVNHKLEIKN